MLINVRPYQSGDLQEENRRIRLLAAMVDGTQACIRRGGCNDLNQAFKLVERVRLLALSLFPGKESAWEIIYK
ncbi:MAG: hypothetical protein PVG03_00205, partial [Desulfarculaceae bacterium]